MLIHLHVPRRIKFMQFTVIDIGCATQSSCATKTVSVVGKYHSQSALVDKVQLARHLLLKHNRVARDDMYRFQNNHERVEKTRLASRKVPPNERTTVYHVSIVGTGHLDT